MMTIIMDVCVVNSILQFSDDDDDNNDWMWYKSQCSFVMIMMIIMILPDVNSSLQFCNDNDDVNDWMLCKSHSTRADTRTLKKKNQQN